jgi:acetyl-CoA C-acetyltransferase
MANPTRSVAIVSATQTQFRAAWPRHQHVDLIGAAVTDALKGASVTIQDVDFVIDCGSDVLDGRSISNCGFLGAMGAHHKEESRVEEDGLWGAVYATTKIKAGPASVGLVVAYSKPSESSVDAYYSTLAEPFYQRPLGMNQKVASGLAAREYLTANGLSEDVLAEPAAFAWACALRNPLVELDEAPDAEAIIAGELVASPLRRHQLSRPVDGAVAIVVAAGDVARRMTASPVWITGMGAAIDSQQLTDRKPGEFEAAAAAASAAYRRAGVSDPASFWVAEVSATSIAEELMVVEALGLADRGNGASLYSDDSPIVLNPSGGALPADPIMATGLARLGEATRYLLQSGGAGRRAVVHGAGGIGMQNHCVITLEV